MDSHRNRLHIGDRLMISTFKHPYLPNMKRILIVSLLPLAGSWVTCPSGAICPDENRCCGEYCLSGSKGSWEESNCCEESHTGCGKGFLCGLNGMCVNSNLDNEDLPEKVPRYKLCHLENHATLQHIYGMPIHDECSRKSNLRCDKPSYVALYLSNLGVPILNGNRATINERFATIEHAILLIHGSLRNPEDYLCCATSALDSAHLNVHSSNTTILIAPWFVAPEDGPINVTYPTSDRPNEPLRWVARNGQKEHTWRYGADAINAPISSYQVIDTMISILQDKTLFPKLSKVVVAGHSAGGQLAQRWALLSHKAGSEFVRIVAANPKSFAYLDDRRLMYGKYFRAPSTSELNDCTQYNEWEWGLDNSTGMVYSPYKDRAIQTVGGRDSLIRRYAERDVIYLSGEQDVLWNGRCEAMMQGVNRLSRSTNFFQSLKHFYGRNIHRRWTVPNVHHDHCLMFQSIQGQMALFGQNDIFSAQK